MRQELQERSAHYLCPLQSFFLPVCKKSPCYHTASPAPTLGTISPGSLAWGAPALFPREQFEPTISPVLGAMEQIPVPLGHGWEDPNSFLHQTLSVARHHHPTWPWVDPSSCIPSDWGRVGTQSLSATFRYRDPRKVLWSITSYLPFHIAVYPSCQAVLLGACWDAFALKTTWKISLLLKSPPWHWSHAGGDAAPQQLLVVHNPANSKDSFKVLSKHFR